MSRRGKSGASESSPKEKNSEDDTSKMNDSKTEWSEQERNRLLDALKSDEGKNNWRWIARQVKTRTTAQVKEFASKIRTEKQGSNKRAIAPKDDSPLEGWINATKRLRGDDNVDGTCIPQNQASRAQQHTDSPRKEVDEACNKKMDQHHGSDDDKEEQQDSTADDISDQHQSAPLSGSNHNKDVQEPDSIMEDLLTNQKLMIEKISVLETKLEKLHSDRGNTKDADKQMIEKICVLDSKLEQLRVQSDDASSQSTVIELLVKINDKLDQLGKNASHSCCGGPVIIQTTPRANVVHQPILDSCSSCRDSKKEKICERSTSVSSEDSTCTTLRGKEDQVSASPLHVNATSVRTSTDVENVPDKNIRIYISGNQPSDIQNDPFRKPQTIANGASSLGVTSSLSSVVASPMLKNKQEDSLINVSCEPDSKVDASVCSKQLPTGNSEHSPKEDTCSLVVTEDRSLPNGTRSVTSIVNQSPVATTASSTSLLTEVTTILRQLRDSSPHSKHNKTPTQIKQLTLPCTQAGSSYPAPVQVIPAPSLQSSYNDRQIGLISNHVGGSEPVHKTGHNKTAEVEPNHQRTAMVCPVSISTVVRNPPPNYHPVGMSSGPSHHLPQQAILVVSSSGAACTPLQNSKDPNSPKVPLLSVTPTSVKKSIPPGYISLSHTTDVMPSLQKVLNTTTWQPQTVTTTTTSHSTQQGKEVHVSPAAGAVVQKADDANSKQSNVEQKDLLNAAMLVNNYVLEHHNQENQTQWQSCLTAIISDYQKSHRDPSKGDLLQLVSIGYNPFVLLKQYELEDALEKSKDRPKIFALRLAEKLFGMDVLIKSTPYGIGGKAALNPAILDAIKVEVLQRFASSMPNEARIELWKGCVTSIAQRCKRARNPRRNRSSSRMKISDDDDDQGPPSMAVGSEKQYDEHDDSQADSDEEYEDFDMDNMDEPSSRQSPPTVRISSDSEQEEPQNGGPDDLLGVDHNEIHHLKQAIDSSVRRESTAEDTERDIPPGIDPDITVVHLPSTMQTAVKVQSKQTDQLPSPILMGRNNVSATGIENSHYVSPERIENLGAQSASIQEPYEHENDSDSPEKNVVVPCKCYGDFPSVVGTIYKPSLASSESVIVSGIKMTPDFCHVLVGGNPNVSLPRQKYLDALTRSGQPTHFAVRLAELAFGDDVLRASTVTGGKRGTLQLDPTVIDAIQTEVTDRFLKEVSKEQQTAAVRKCITSIATRCKTLRYNRSKMLGENNWTIHENQTGTQTEDVKSQS